MSNKNVGIMLLSSVLTFTAPSLYSQTNPEKPAKTVPSEQTKPAKGTMSSKGETMEKGAATQDNIKKAQQALKDKGLYTGAVDGTMNSDFEAALRTYQTDNKLQATGKLDRETMTKLGVGHEKGMKHEGMTSKESTMPGKETTSPEKKSTAPAKTQKKGGKQGSLNQSSQDVRQIQTALKDQGFDPGPVDGVMGPKTHRAIADFQRQKNLFASGNLDERTKTTLGVSTTTMPSEEPTREKPGTTLPKSEKPSTTPPTREKPSPTPDVTPSPDNPPDRVPQPQTQPPNRVEPDTQHHSSVNAGTLAAAQQTPNIGLGSASTVEDVRQLQMALRNRGYDPGEVNGIVTSQTQDAIRDFQAANNLPVTGVLDDRTQAALGVNIRGTRNPDTPPIAPEESLNNSFDDHASSNAPDIERSKSGLGGPQEQPATATPAPQYNTKHDKYKSDKHHAGTADADMEKRITKSTEVITSLTTAGDKRIPEDLLGRAAGIVVIPDMIKGAFGIGGRYGKGVVSKRMDNGHWSAPAFVSIGGGSFGAQLGVSSTDLVLVFTDRDAFDALQKKMSLKLGADAAVAAGPIGRSGEAGVTHDLKSGIYAYSRSKGLFAGISLDGAVIDIDEKDNQKMYGANVDTAAILSNPTMISVGNARSFVDALDRVAVKRVTN